MGLILKDQSDSRSDPKGARLRAGLLAAPFALLGIVALVGFIHDGLIIGGLDRKRTYELLSTVAVSIGFVALIFGISLKREALKRGIAKPEADKPWLGRKEWAKGRMRSTSKKGILLLWILVFFWCFCSAAISFAVMAFRWHQRSQADLIVLIFPMVGLALIIFAIRTTCAWRRFGAARFEMPAVPAAAGGALTGCIHVPGTLRPQNGWHLSLSCLRRKTAGSSSDVRTTERVLWRDEKWLQPNLPQTDSGQTSIPVFFRLPEGKPESTPAAGDGTYWRLDAWARLKGPDFQASFEVPVFKLPGTPEIPEDRSAPYQRSLEQIQKEIRSRIQVLGSSEGKEFIFPGGRAPGFAAGATVLCLVWTVMILLLAVHRAPAPILLIFGVMDLFMLYFLSDLWFGRSRVVVSAGTIKAEATCLGFKKRFEARCADVGDIAAETGPTVGYSAYYDLKLRARDGKEWTLAKYLNHKPEADWLARQIATAVRNTSTTEATP